MTRYGAFPIGALPKGVDTGRLFVIAKEFASFSTAHSALLEKYKDNVKLTPPAFEDLEYIYPEDTVPSPRMQLLKDLWLKEYKARVVGEWTGLEFETAKQATMFRLRWTGVHNFHD